MDSALESLARRLALIDQVERMIALLNQLAGRLPASLASLLTAIRDDLSRVTA